ncbi:MAG: hypothetical protein IGBAC_2007 [Ignavibacteriae bacterium]|nr:MAG: hypothetical protein IGBAC_2007 [Ignavibacteriota bacterium]
MNDEIKKQIPWTGIILIILGLTLLLNRTNIINVHFSQIIWGVLILFGFVHTIRGYKYNQRGKIFWGTVIFLFSLYFLLNTLDFFEFRHRIFIPAVFLIFGFAFLTTYINNLRDVISLILSVMLISSGFFLILEDFGYFDWFNVRSVIKTYWPVVLIILGLGMLLKKRKQIND